MSCIISENTLYSVTNLIGFILNVSICMCFIVMILEKKTMNINIFFTYYMCVYIIFGFIICLYIYFVYFNFTFVICLVFYL